MTQFTTELLNFGSIISVVGKTTVEIIELFEMVPPQGWVNQKIEGTITQGGNKVGIKEGNPSSDAKNSIDSDNKYTYKVKEN